MAKENIRNFCIIAHIDHGKSTLADRLLEKTKAVSPREFKNQLLDAMDLERERGITIKAHAVRLQYTSRNGRCYLLNLIDTPGHVDFTYEVSRSLAACEGAILVVDASQGVEAQTIANTLLAMESNLVIIPVINKIDLPSADIERCRHQIKEVLGLNGSEAILTSAKEGSGTEDVLEAIVENIPPPAGSTSRPLRALIVDSWFDNYQGAVILVRVMEGHIETGSRLLFMSNQKNYQVNELGVFTPKPMAVTELATGEVGYVIAGIKNVSDTKIGDTVTDADNPAKEPCPGYKEAKAMVFCGLYAIDADQYEDLREALEKLRLNDSSFSFEMETSLALGFGFRCGFLGLLHMEITKERLEREYRLALISTAPTVVYQVTMQEGNIAYIDNPAKLPEANGIIRFEEPYIVATIITPEAYLGSILKLCQDRRGTQRDLKFLDKDRIVINYELPFNEVVLDFYDRLKSVSRGYASLDYEFIGYFEADLVKVDILLNSETVDALSFITHRNKAYHRARLLAEKMKELIPRQMFEVAIQAAIGSKIIARETIRAMRKNVTAKCYGGDITRKRKLWAKQKEGKKRMKQVGRVEIPQEAFLAVLKVQE